MWFVVEDLVVGDFSGARAVGDGDGDGFGVCADDGEPGVCVEDGLACVDGVWGEVFGLACVDVLLVEVVPVVEEGGVAVEGELELFVGVGGVVAVAFEVVELALGGGVVGFCRC